MFLFIVWFIQHPLILSSGKTYGADRSSQGFLTTWNCALVRRKAGCKDTVGSGTWTGHYRPFSHAELPRSTTSMVANSLNQCFLLSKWSVDSTHVSPFISSSYHAGLDSDSSEMSVCNKHLIAFLICSFFLPFIYSRCDCRLSLAEIPLKHILYFLHSCF